VRKGVEVVSNASPMRQGVFIEWLMNITRRRQSDQTTCMQRMKAGAMLIYVAPIWRHMEKVPCRHQGQIGGHAKGVRYETRSVHVPVIRLQASGIRVQGRVSGNDKRKTLVVER